MLFSARARTCLFAMEYRRLRTFTIYDSSYEAGQLNLSDGGAVLRIEVWIWQQVFWLLAVGLFLSGCDLSCART